MCVQQFISLVWQRTPSVMNSFEPTYFEVLLPRTSLFLSSLHDDSSSLARFFLMIGARVPFLPLPVLLVSIRSEKKSTNHLEGSTRAARKLVIFGLPRYISSCDSRLIWYHITSLVLCDDFFSKTPKKNDHHLDDKTEEGERRAEWHCGRDDPRPTASTRTQQKKKEIDGRSLYFPFHSLLRRAPPRKSLDTVVCKGKGQTPCIKRAAHTQQFDGSFNAEADVLGPIDDGSVHSGTTKEERKPFPTYR